MPTILRPSILLLTTLIPCACEATGDPMQPGGDDTGGEAGPTFWRDVAPLYYEHCVACHRDGGSAPFALDDYASAEAWGRVSASAVTARTMPPWLATDDGSCGTFRDSRALAPAEIDTIVAWVDEGMVEGEPRDDLELPVSPELTGATVLSTPSFVPEIEGGPLARFDEYRCFTVDRGVARDAFITGYDVQPGNAAIVHHVLMGTVDPAFVTLTGETNQEVMDRLAAESPDRDGWRCYEGMGEGVEPSALAVSWAPGQGVVEFPDHTGLWVGQDEQMVVQVHYNLADPDTLGQADSTDVLVRLEQSVEQPGFMTLPDGLLSTLFDGEPYALEPGDPELEFTWEVPVAALVGDTPLQIYGVLPHMHELGRSIQLEVVRGDEATCGIDVPRWDFDWQLMYFYDEPLVLQPDDLLRVTCTYDTTTVEEPVTPGWGTGSEMCLMGLFAVPLAP